MCQIFECSSRERERERAAITPSKKHASHSLFFLACDPSSRPPYEDGGEWRELLKGPHFAPRTVKEELYATKYTYRMGQSYFRFLLQ